MPRITQAEFKKLHAAKQVLPIDVRDPHAFDAGHIPGALNVSFVDVEIMANRLLKETQPIVAYCACPDEMTRSPAWPSKLMRVGVKDIRVLAGGWDGWTAGGGKVELTPPSGALRRRRTATQRTGPVAHRSQFVRLMVGRGSGGWPLSWVGVAGGAGQAGQLRRLHRGTGRARHDASTTAQCASCHELSRFKGKDFASAWADKPLTDLHTAVKSMPMDNPGSLKPEEYADILAYFLSINGYPAGETELAGTEDGHQGHQGRRQEALAGLSDSTRRTRPSAPISRVERCAPPSHPMTDAERWQLVKDLAGRALEHDDGQRAGWLAAQDVPDVIRQEAARLLDADAHAGAFLAADALDAAVAAAFPADADPSPAAAEGEALGAYRIVRLLGARRHGRGVPGRRAPTAPSASRWRSSWCAPTGRRGHWPHASAGAPRSSPRSTIPTSRGCSTAARPTMACRTS